MFVSVEGNVTLLSEALFSNAPPAMPFVSDLNETDDSTVPLYKYATLPA